MPKLICADCGESMILGYGKFGWFYHCRRWPTCQGAVGAHQKTKAPLGTPANAETRKLRMIAHDRFDQLWRGAGTEMRNAAYSWLAERLGLTKERCHIAMFDADQCRAVIREAEGMTRDALRQWWKQQARTAPRIHIAEDVKKYPKNRRTRLKKWG